MGELAFAQHSQTPARPASAHASRKLLSDLNAAFDACEIRDGATLSFHHHLRNGDGVLNAVLAVAAQRGLKNLSIAPSSVFGVHAPLVEHIRHEVVTGIFTAYIAGPVADAVSRGLLATPVVMQTHGGRARAIEAGELPIDVAFIAAPSADDYGNINGMDGPAACGTMGYAIADARFARKVVAVTDNLVPYPACPIAISQDHVDFVVPIASIGDPAGIASGTTRATDDPVGLAIAATAAQVIDASGLLVDGFSFQTGAGGMSIATAEALRAIMQRKHVRGSFAAGGIHGHIVAMFEEGLFRSLLDVQCFDLQAVASFRRNRAHQQMSASMYGNPANRGAVVDRLDTMVLGATQIDLDFNVNVTTSSHGVLMGGSGGHADTAAGSKLALVTTRLTAAHHPKIVEKVGTVTTPGATIDAVVTEAGVAVNPRRGDLTERLRRAAVPLVSIEELAAKAAAKSRVCATPPTCGKVVARMQYRDGTIIDEVRAVDVALVGR